MRYLLIPVGIVVTFYAVVLYKFHKHWSNYNPEWMQKDWPGWKEFCKPAMESDP